MKVRISGKITYNIQNMDLEVADGDVDDIMELIEDGQYDEQITNKLDIFGDVENCRVDEVSKDE
jgi:hypothetical protein